MTETSSLYAFVDYTYNLLVTNKSSLGLQGVFYGDQNLIPASPIACVEPDTSVSVLASAQRRVENNFRVYVLVYSAFVESPDLNRRDADQRAEAIKAVLNADALAGGLVTHCMVEEVASGYAQKAGAIYRSSRILFTGKSKTQLPMS